MDMTSSSLIKSQVKTVNPDLSIEAAAEFLLSHKLANAPVVDDIAHSRKLLGFLSEADCLNALAGKLYFQRFDGSEFRVKDIMKVHPICLSEDINIFTLANLFLQHSFRQMPVVDKQGVFKGVVSRSDVLDVLLKIEKDHEKQKYKNIHKTDLHQIVDHRFILKS